MITMQKVWLVCWRWLTQRHEHLPLKLCLWWFLDFVHKIFCLVIPLSDSFPERTSPSTICLWWTGLFSFKLCPLVPMQRTEPTSGIVPPPRMIEEGWTGSLNSQTRQKSSAAVFFRCCDMWWCDQLSRLVLHVWVSLRVWKADTCSWKKPCITAGESCKSISCLLDVLPDLSTFFGHHAIGINGADALLNWLLLSFGAHM